MVVHLPFTTLYAMHRTIEESHYGFNGTIKLLSYSGHVAIAYDLSMPHAGVVISLPAACQNATGS